MEPNNQPVSTEQKKIGPIIAILVVVLVIIIGALYFFSSKVDEPAIPNETAQTEVQAVTSTSDDVQDIYDDLKASVEGIDTQNF